MVVLFCAVASTVGGCAQTSDFTTDVKDNAFRQPMHFFSVPSWAKANEAGNDFDLMPKGPVAANNLISASGYCAPAAKPATPPPQAAAQKRSQATAAAQASAPPPDQLQPAGQGSAPAMQAPVFGGVSLGMSECAVARTLGTPSNVSISRSPKGKRRVVLTYNGGDRPGVYSFLSGRLIQIDATAHQASKYDRQVKKPRRARRTRDQMYVQ
jgi:hypothetical protein